jgi:hypothetical protein
VSQLRVGDVVWEHGMRIELDREPIVFDVDGRCGPAYSFNGKVLNIADITDSFILTMTEQWDGGTLTHRWTVQSNDLVQWVREVR